jgi:(5-formylfuran-3-yl)methyl phosphate synthase
LAVPVRTQTRFLASVRDAAEATIALQAGADLIDFKEPSAGSLGAVDLTLLAKAVCFIAGRTKTSATIGDLPMESERLRKAVSSVGATGVDYIKLGVFPDRRAKAAVAELAPVARDHSLILVLFADGMPEFDAVALAAAIGAHGIMLDTMEKNGGSLLDHLEIGEIAQFVSRAREHGLIVGLAGSLKARHVAALLALRPSLLGFRSALCREGARETSIDFEACAGIRSLIPVNGPNAEMPTLLSPALC